MSVLSFNVRDSIQLPLYKRKDLTKSSRNDQTKIMKQKKIPKRNVYINVKVSDVLFNLIKANKNEWF